MHSVCLKYKVLDYYNPIKGHSFNIYCAFGVCVCVCANYILNHQKKDICDLGSVFDNLQ